ncbi:MAG: VCBS repeat-containing protein [Planctomycetes bacterium]|nr:VCBS repeat-containing protein [Planctomycetota bacterium]
MRSSILRTSLFALIALALGIPLHAQGVWFDAQHKTHLELPTAGVVRLLMADIDGDADDDLLWIGRPNHIARRVAPGFFVADPAGIVIAGTTSNLDAAVGDIDADGDLDVVIACGSYNFGRPRPNQLWINAGDGTFADESNLRFPSVFPGDDTRAVALRDFDGDGDLDVFLAQADPDDLLLLNDGTGRFTASPNQLPAGSRSNHMLSFDVDGDSDFDLVVEEIATGFLRVYRNDGTGRFTAAPTSPPQSFLASAFASVDVDGDGLTDVVVGTIAQPSLIFRNQGSGNFTFFGRLPASVDRPTSIAPIDMDADGDMDLLLSNVPDGVVVLENRSGTYVDVTATHLPSTVAHVLTGQLVVNDLDGDGDLDFISAAPVRPFLNDGAGLFRDASGRHAAWIRENVQVRDFDGDGDADIVSARLNDTQVHVDLNDGHGTFTRQDPTAFPPLPHGYVESIYGIAAEDLDGDGDFDLAIARGSGFSNDIWMNDGSANFFDVTPAVIRADVDATFCTAAADIDGDGDVDLLFGKGRAVDRLYRNDGNGLWSDVSATQLPALASGSLGCRFGDVDGDGDPDLLLVSWERVQNSAKLYENVGNGVFVDRTASALPTGLFPYEGGIGLGDADGDGDLDVVFESRLLLNDGNGVFTNESRRVTGAIGIDPHFVDVDGDGDLDLATYPHCLVNVGGGYFVESNEYFGTFMPRVYAVADLDDDGDPDAVTSDGPRFNLARQLHAPVVARLGQPFTVAAYEVQHATAPRAVLLFAAAALAATPYAIPSLGNLHLDLATFSYLDTLLLAPLAEKASRSYLIPNDAHLAGMSFSFQGLAVPAGSNTQWRFTNVITEVVNP